MYKQGKRFHVVRGIAKPAGRDFVVGLTYIAKNARDAVKQDKERIAIQFAPGPLDALIGRRKPNPILRVYEMVLLDKSEWK